MRKEGGAGKNCSVKVVGLFEVFLGFFKRVILMWKSHNIFILFS